MFERSNCSQVSALQRAIFFLSIFLTGVWALPPAIFLNFFSGSQVSARYREVVKQLCGDAGLVYTLDTGANSALSGP